MWHSMGLPAKVVGAFLVSMGLASLTAFIERLIALRRSRAESARFAREAGDDLQAGAVDAVMAEAAKYPRGHLPRLVQSGLGVYAQARSTDADSSLSAAERARRQLERTLEELSADLRRGLSILASVGSVAPFVGLLLVLLIIFMVVAPRLDQDLQVDLPGIFNPDPQVETSADPLKVSVARPGEYYIDEQKYDLDGAIAALGDAHAVNPLRRLVL